MNSSIMKMIYDSSLALGLDIYNKDTKHENTKTQINDKSICQEAAFYAGYEAYLTELMVHG